MGDRPIAEFPRGGSRVCFPGTGCRHRAAGERTGAALRGPGAAASRWMAPDGLRHPGPRAPLASRVGPGRDSMARWACCIQALEEPSTPPYLANISRHNSKTRLVSGAFFSCVAKRAMFVSRPLSLASRRRTRSRWLGHDSPITEARTARARPCAPARPATSRRRSPATTSSAPSSRSLAAGQLSTPPCSHRSSKSWPVTSSARPAGT